MAVISCSYGPVWTADFFRMWRGMLKHMNTHFWRFWVDQVLTVTLFLATLVAFYALAVVFSASVGGL